MFTHRLRVLYGDTDAAGIVYHANYLRFFEAARGEFLRQAGMSYAAIEREGYVWPVVESWLRHRHPARYDEELDIGVAVDSVGAASATLVYEVRSGGRLLCEGRTRLACTRRDGGVARIPPRIREMLSGHLKSVNDEQGLARS